MAGYDIIQDIGEGEYGKVYKAKETSTGRIVALKQTSFKVSEGIHPTTLREIAILTLLSKSRYIVNFFKVVGDLPKSGPNAPPEHTIYLVFEYLDTDLKNFIHSNPKGENPGPFPNSLVRDFLFQLCKGVAHCHSHNVLHRDLKPQNLLLDTTKMILKIADFGLARANADPLRPYSLDIATLNYRAPEIFFATTTYSTGVDIWSIGCIFAEMVTGEVLFDGKCENDILLRIFRLLGTPTEKQWPELSSMSGWNSNIPIWTATGLTGVVPSLETEGVDLLSEMLKYNPHERISAKAALGHPYFNSLDKSQYDDDSSLG